MPVIKLIEFLSLISGFFPVLAALINYRNLDKVLVIAAIYFLVSVLSDLVQQVTQLAGMPNNYPVFHIYIALSCLLLGAMYYYALFNIILKKVILILAGLVFIATVVNMFAIEGILDYPSLSNTLLSIMVICFSLVYFYQLLNRQEFVHIEKQALFWINAGMLFYSAVNIFLFMLFKRLLSEHLEGLYMINNITNIVANILFTIGLLCRPPKQKATSSRY